MRGEPVFVMLVEDNIDHAELVMRTLENHRIANQIKHFSDGQNALDYLLRHNDYQNPESSPRPHLILLDLRLPRVDGLEVLRQIKEQDELKNIPVIDSVFEFIGEGIVTAHQRETTTATVLRFILKRLLLTNSTCFDGVNSSRTRRPTAGCSYAAIIAAATQF